MAFYRARGDLAWLKGLVTCGISTMVGAEKVGSLIATRSTTPSMS